MINLIQPIISICIISLIWIWIIRQIFIEASRKEIMTTSLRSIISVLSISAIHYLGTQYSIREQYNTEIYISITIISVLLFIQKKRTISWVIQALLRFIASFFGGNLGQYSIGALGEESFKRIYIKKFIFGIMGEIILLGIISGIVFARTENIIYLLQSLGHSTFIENITLLQQRSFIPLVVHSGSLCISILVGYKLQNQIGGIGAWILGIMSGILLHYLFNIFQINNTNIGIITTIIVYIGAIHYSLFRSNILYSSKNNI